MIDRMWVETMARYNAWQNESLYFIHQTHHRGQAPAMLTAAGAKPDHTDLPILHFRQR